MTEGTEKLDDLLAKGMRTIWGLLHADDASLVSLSSHSLAKGMADTMDM